MSRHKPNLILNDEEQELLGTAPEGCLRRVVARGALPLDQITESLPPRVAAALRSIVTGERLAALDVEPEPERDITDWGLTRAMDDSSWPQAAVSLVREMLPSHPQLVRMLDEEILTPGETMDVAHAIDYALGRYLTGTRYAAP